VDFIFYIVKMYCMQDWRLVIQTMRRRLCRDSVESTNDGAAKRRGSMFSKVFNPLCISPNLGGEERYIYALVSAQVSRSFWDSLSGLFEHVLDATMNYGGKSRTSSNF